MDLLVLISSAFLLTLTHHIAYARHYNEDLHSLNKLAHLDAMHLEQIFGDLLNKLGETAFSMPDFRVKRQSSYKNSKGDRLCCAFPVLSNKQDVRQCHKQFILNSNITTNDSTTQQKQIVSQCFMECVAAKKGWINAAGYAERSAVNASLQVGEMSPQWRRLQAEAVDKCFTQLESEQDKLENVPCKSGSQHLLYCIFEHTFLNCPKDSWHESEKCRAALSLVHAASTRRHSRSERQRYTEKRTTSSTSN